MTNSAFWFQTQLPDDVMQIVFKELNELGDTVFSDSNVCPDLEGEIDSSIRKSKNCWIPTSHWIGEIIWHYVMIANRENFLYDISHIQNKLIQYTHYDKGDYYDWHTDEGEIRMFGIESVRKLSFTIQLSNSDDYTGGDLEFSDSDNGKISFKSPRDRGCMVIFDSRTLHRVSPVESGFRRSLVGWVEGSR